MGLISRANVKTLWGISDTSQDDVIDLLISQCSARIVTFLGHEIEAASFTEYYRGTGTRYLVLRQWPINSVASVNEDMNGQYGQDADPFPASTLLAQGTDYAIVKDGPGGSARSGMLRKINGIWQKPGVYEPGLISPQPGETSGTIKVVYNAGFATVPADIQQACLMLMACVKRIMKIGQPLTSEGWEDYQYAVAQAAGEAVGGLPPDTLGVLSRYRNIPVG